MSKCNTCINKKYCENHLDARTMCAKTDYVLFTPTYETNADRIRSMTDEELTEFIIGVCHEYYGFRRKIESGRIEFIEWLKSPTEGEG